MPPKSDSQDGNPFDSCAETVRGVITDLPTAVAIFDRAMRYVAYSRTFAENFGVADNDLIGKCHYDVFPDAKPKWRENNARCLAGETLGSEEEPWERADGSTEWVRWQLRPLRDTTGAVVGVVMHSEIITDRKLTAERIHQSEERFRSLVETTDDFVWEIDEELRYTYASPQVREILGYAPDELIGRQPWDFMSASEARRVVVEIGEALAHHESFRAVENENRRRDGTAVVLESSGVAFFDSDGNWRGYRGIDRDVTARRQAKDEMDRLLRNEKSALAAAQREASQLAALLAQVTEGVAIFDRAGRSVILNAAARDMLDIPSDLRAENLPELGAEAEHIRLFDDRGRELPAAELPGQRVLRGETFGDQPLSLIRRDGRRRYLLASGTSVRDASGQVELGLLVYRDVTRLRENEQAREDLIRMTSHDLRNPLTVIAGQSEWLRRLLERRGLVREAASADSIHRGAQRMNSMIQDLVESFRLESGSVELRTRLTNLVDFVKDVVGRVGTLADQMRISVDCPAPVGPALVDPDRIERAIVNLLTNALKYSPPDAPVVVRLASDGDEAVISVEDRGVGIAPEDQPHVFERYFRAKSTAAAAEGLGLGLYIARLIAEAHNGRVSVESEMGKGSTFSIRLPLSTDLCHDHRPVAT